MCNSREQSILGYDTYFLSLVCPVRARVIRRELNYRDLRRREQTCALLYGIRA